MENVPQILFCDLIAPRPFSFYIKERMSHHKMFYKPTLFQKIIISLQPNSEKNPLQPIWRDARVVEEARLESVYTPKGYRGFESPSLREELID